MELEGEVGRVLNCYSQGQGEMRAELRDWGWLRWTMWETLKMCPVSVCICFVQTKHLANSFFEYFQFATFKLRSMR